MAEKKYDLALVNTLKEKPIKHQSWYKERLETKYIKQLKPGERVQTKSTQNWLFFKDGLDDFRDGLPPAVEGSDYVKSDKGFGPSIQGEFVRGAVKVPAAQKRLSRHQVYISKCTPQQQQRRDYINEVEQGLLKHPLALYPHLEESVAPERRRILEKRLKKLGDLKKGDHKGEMDLFEDIVDLLDPQFNIQDMQDVDDVLEDVTEKSESSTMTMTEEESTAGSVQGNRQEEEERLLREAEGGIVKNPYRWLTRKEASKDTKKDGKKNKEKDQKLWPASASEEEHIKNVTQEFCEWVADLGGESNNIEESTITSLFASGYETKPALSVPIHVVELTNVPQELRLSAAVPPATEKRSVIGEKPKQKISGDYEPSWVRFQYGAWYLSPRTWKKRNYNEPLLDPKQLKDQEMSEAKKKSTALNQDLATMHASRAFHEFISKKGTRCPEFLTEVAEIQRKVAEEEQRRLEAEMNSKHKKMTPKPSEVPLVTATSTVA